jgi:hypothetical protein
MRLTLVVVLCLLNAACAVARKDKDEPVDNGPKREKVEPVLKPSEALKPKTVDLASPITDHFYMRGTYWPATADTQLRVDPFPNFPGTPLDAEEDLGLDDKVDQGRMEFDIRMARRGHMRIDYFKLNRFGQEQLQQDTIFGPFLFPEGTDFRTKLDWRVLSLTYTYSFLKFERFEAGLGLGAHIIEGHLEGGTPGPGARVRVDAIGVFPTIAVNAAARISNRWSITLRGQQYRADPQDFDGKMSDYHGDIQFRWRKNFAFGLGYTMLETDLEITDAGQTMLFNLNTTGPEVFFRVSF